MFAVSPNHLSAYRRGWSRQPVREKNSWANQAMSETLAKHSFANQARWRPWIPDWINVADKRDQGSTKGILARLHQGTDAPV